MAAPLGRSLGATELQALLDEPEDQVRNQTFYVHGFDKSFTFLLTLQYDNLFEPWISQFRAYEDGWWWRCKGCGRMVKRNGRQSHHTWHKEGLL